MFSIMKLLYDNLGLISSGLNCYHLIDYVILTNFFRFGQLNFSPSPVNTGQNSQVCPPVTGRVPTDLECFVAHFHP